jgi:hypothetical protein
MGERSQKFQYVAGVIVILTLEWVYCQVDSSNRQACFKFQGECAQYPEWGGTRDDSEWAYVNKDVGRNRETCLARAKEYFEWCGNRPENPVRMVHVPSGSLPSYPLQCNY